MLSQTIGPRRRLQSGATPDNGFKCTSFHIITFLSPPASSFALSSPSTFSSLLFLFLCISPHLPLLTPHLFCFFSLLSFYSSLSLSSHLLCFLCLSPFLSFPFHSFPSLSSVLFSSLFTSPPLLSSPLLSSQCLFDSWLTQKEELVRSIKTSNLKDQAEMVACLRRLAVSQQICFSFIKKDELTERNISNVCVCVSFYVCFTRR